VIHEFNSDALTTTGDVFCIAADLVAVPSVSFDERRITDLIEAVLRAEAPHLEVTRVGDNVVARTDLGLPSRIALGGHTDTVPPNNNTQARITEDSNVLWGLGATDMKGGVAAMLKLATAATRPVADVTYVFYAREEVAFEHNGLREIADQHPRLLDADVAVLLEPTGGVIEAGCQGTMRIEVHLQGVRAHTARAWMGRNAIHRLHRLLALVDAYEPRRPLIAGCEYHEGLQAVAVTGGVAGNVVPGSASLTLNHRFAPDRSPDQAEGHVRELIEPLLEPGDSLAVLDFAPGAMPGLDHELLGNLVTASGVAPRAKLGWTDVSFFWERGVPASNFGPGDPLLAHTSGEHLRRDSLDAVYCALHDLLTGKRN